MPINKENYSEAAQGLQMTKIEFLAIFATMAYTAKLISLAYENCIQYRCNANNAMYRKAWNFRWFAVRLIGIYEAMK